MSCNRSRGGFSSECFGNEIGSFAIKELGDGNLSVADDVSLTSAVDGRGKGEGVFLPAHSTVISLVMESLLPPLGSSPGGIAAERPVD